MPHPHTNDFLARLRQLPGQLILALLNGTAVLVIVAALLALAATTRVTHLAENVATTMTDAVLSHVTPDPRRLVEKLGSLSTDIQSLRTALQDAKAEKRVTLDPAIDRLSESLASLETSIGQLRDARSRLMDEATARLSLALGEALQDFGVCKASAARQ